MPPPLVPAPFGSGVAFVTGAWGFLGGATLCALQLAGWRVAAFGHPPRTPALALPETPVPTLAQPGDIERDSLSRAAAALGRPEFVFHAAGGASVAASIADPGADHARTIGSLTEVLAFAKASAPAARLIYPSSAAVYGSGHPGPIREDAGLDPISPYGTHKRMAEELIAEGAADFGLDAVAVRFFSLYGPGLRKQLPWELAGRLLAGPGRIELGGTGEEVRDFLFVDDAVRFVGMAAGLERSQAPRIVNGGAGRPTTVRELAEGLRAALGASNNIAFSGLVRAGDPASLLADPARAHGLGLVPVTSLDDGLARLAGWVRTQKLPARG